MSPARIVLVKQALGITAALALTVGIASGMALALQSGFQPVYEAQRSTRIRAELGRAAAQREARAARKAVAASPAAGSSAASL